MESKLKWAHTNIEKLLALPFTISVTVISPFYLGFHYLFFLLKRKAVHTANFKSSDQMFKQEIY
jgi:hypothetical protein